jgi:adenylate kinase
MMPTKPVVVILLGPPGSGKGTQAPLLSKHLNIPHISTGDLFRENIRNETVLGLRVKQCIAEGKLVPDSLVLDMLFDRLLRDDCQNGYVLDGVPRTIEQAQAIDEYLKTKNDPLVFIIQIDLDDQTIVERISGRLTCQQCKSVYHKTAHPPKHEGICDACMHLLVQRPDDRQEVVRERLKTYHELTKPVLEYYSSQRHVHHVDGSKSQPAVFEDLLSNIPQKC